MLTGTGESRTEIVPEQWRKISVAMPNPEHPADTLWVDMLRSTQWGSTASCRVGGQVWIELEEIGYQGWAKVRAVEPCPEIATGEGRVVTATLNHYNSYVYELKLAGTAEPLRPTDRHPIFSETRQKWVRAADLRAGEQVKTASGAVEVESIARVPGMHRVYNLEVEEDHRYFAGAARVLSHNTGTGPGCPLTVPGRVQSRINLETSAMDHIKKRHLSGFPPNGPACSKFYANEASLRRILQSDRVVKTPISRVLASNDGPRYVREVLFEHPIGDDMFKGFKPTKFMTVLSDGFGNIVTATPGLIP